MNKYLLFVGILGVMFIIPKRMVAQQNAQFTQYMMNPMFYNPGYSGMDGSAKFSLLHRTQWAGYSPTVGSPSNGNPQTQLLSYNMPLYKISSGVGFTLVNDQIGIRRNTLAQLSYAYHLTLGKGKLGIGVRAGIFSLGSRSGYLVNDVNDPVYLALNQNQSQIRPDFGGGLWYKHEKYFGGFGVYHLIPQKFDYGVKELDNTQVQHYYLTGGYNYEVNYNFILTPSFLYKAGDFKSKASSFDLNLLATIEQKYWAGVSYRQQDAVSAIVGLSLLKDNSLKLSYAFDYTVPGTKAKAPTSHEIMVSYALPVELKGSKPIIRTPRYRK